ncbi:MAG: hypothetical protein LBC03_02555 [Nitrososphaerota archaeon]|jgi:hypothetical protein|nr:hypothetical protein [Nitrososphaerota archaeon]
MLAHDLYLKNKENGSVEAVKIVVPIKKVFVKADGLITVHLDSKTLEHYGENLNSKGSYYPFQKSLLMPSNNLTSIGLPYRGTGAAAKKPYIEFYGGYRQNTLSLSIAGEGIGQKETYEYTYDFKNSKKNMLTPVDLLLLRLNKKNYFAGDLPLFNACQEAGIITPTGALPSNVFVAVCETFLSFWKEKIAFKELNIFSHFSFRIVVLPYQLLPQGNVEYRSQEKTPVEKLFEDCFGNPATGYPSKATIDAKFVSFDDAVFAINCKTGKEFYQDLDIGNKSFSKIFLPTDHVIKIAGLDWYFFDLTDFSLNFVDKKSGIYDQLLSNYNVLSSNSEKSMHEQTSLKVVCTKRTQAKLEVLINETLTLNQLKALFNRAQDNLSSHSFALELLIIENNKDIFWIDYITAIRCLINDAYFDRAVLVYRFTRIIRCHLRNWMNGNIQIKKESAAFFNKSQFCLNLLTKNRWVLFMNKNEKYAYKIGVIAGKYVKFKRAKAETNTLTKDILTFSKYDREHLRFVYRRIGVGISLSEVNTDTICQAIKNDMPKEEIDDAHALEDFSYFFYKSVFGNLM